MNFRFFVRIVFLTLVFLGQCGCGSSKVVKVDGLVTYDSKPVANAVITFIPISNTGQPAGGVSDGSGKFVVGSFTENDGLVRGDYKVTVTKSPTFQPNFQPLPEEQVIENARNPSPKPASELHENYASAVKTPLRVTVPPGKITLTLKSDGT